MILVSEFHFTILIASRVDRVGATEYESEIQEYHSKSGFKTVGRVVMSTNGYRDREKLKALLKKAIRSKMTFVIRV